MCTLLASAAGGRQVAQAPAALPPQRRGGELMRRIDRQAMVLVVIALSRAQLSKQRLLSYLMAAKSAIVPVIDGFFRLVIVWNRGVSFGLMGGDGALPPWVLSAVAIAVCIGLFVWL